MWRCCLYLLQPRGLAAVCSDVGWSADWRSCIVLRGDSLTWLTWRMSSRIMMTIAMSLEECFGVDSGSLFDRQLQPATETSWVISYGGKTIPRWRSPGIAYDHLAGDDFECFDSIACRPPISNKSQNVPLSFARLQFFEVECFIDKICCFFGTFTCRIMITIKTADCLSGFFLIMNRSFITKHRGWWKIWQLHLSTHLTLYTVCPQKQSQLL